MDCVVKSMTIRFQNSVLVFAAIGIKPRIHFEYDDITQDQRTAAGSRGRLCLDLGPANKIEMPEKKVVKVALGSFMRALSL